MRRGIGICALLAMAFTFLGCRSGDYNTLMQPAKQDYYAGNPQGTLLRMDEHLADADDIDKPLFLMERAVVHERLGNYKEAQQDLIQADEQLEILDFTSDTSGTLLEYTTSADLTLFRGQPHEKIFINTLNMLNFLSEGDLTAARIQARRAAEMYRYQVEVEERFNYKNGLTMLLYGLAFYASGRPNDAYVSFRQAYDLTRAEFLKPYLLHITKEIGHSDAARWESEFGDLPPPVPEGHGQVLIAVLNGQTPIRVSRVTRVPAPMMNVSKDGVSFKQLGIQEIHYPELTKRSHQFNRGFTSIDNQNRQQLVRAVDIESQAMARFEEERPQIIAASVSRLLTRAIIGNIIRSAVEKGVEKNRGKETSSWVSLFLGIAVDRTLASMDVPDVRCWNFLPAEVLVSLATVPAGSHTVTVQMSGGGSMNLQETVEVKANQLSVVQFFVTY